MSIGAGVIIAVALHQIDHAPHGEASAEGDDESLQNGDCLIDECHRISSLFSEKLRDGVSFTPSHADRLTEIKTGRTEGGSA